MAVKPWIGAIVDPTDPPAVNKDEPDVDYALTWVWGYRAEDSRQNLFLNNSGQAVYMTAALGVILDNGSKTQKFFGGGKVDNKGKTVANDQNHHTNDITALSISNDRSLVATGQLGSSPAAFVWDASTGDKKQRFKLSKGSRGISAIAISADNKYVALADLHNDHNIYVYQINDGQLVWKEKGGPDKIYDVAFNPNNSNEFVSAGVKHIKFWYIAEKDIKKGLFMSKGEPTNFPCATYDANGNAWTGGTNGEVYKWDGRSLDSTVKVGGAIHTIRFADGKLLAGGKGQKVYEISNGSANEVVGDVGSLIRSIDCHNGNYIIGTRDGTIQDGNGNIWMRSHSDGEVWGAAQLGEGHFVTTADDNKLIIWDIPAKTA